MTIFFPKNKRWTPDGYRERNQKIVEACTHLLRITRKYGQATYGSGWAADTAESLGKVVKRVVV